MISHDPATQPTTVHESGDGSPQSARHSLLPVLRRGRRLTIATVTVAGHGVDVSAQVPTSAQLLPGRPGSCSDRPRRASGIAAHQMLWAGAADIPASAPAPPSKPRKTFRRLTPAPSRRVILSNLVLSKACPPMKIRTFRTQCRPLEAAIPSLLARTRRG